MTAHDSPAAGEAAAPLRVERDRHLLILTLNRPDRLNALNRPLQSALQAAITDAAADSQVRVIIITGTGRAFCSGADVEHLSEQTGLPMEKQLVQPPPFTARQCKVYKPTICAVNGVCAGAGLHFVADSDLVIAGDSATFVDTHVNVGQVSALEPLGLMARMPFSAVLRMVVLGKAGRITATEALRQHLVSEVVPTADLMTRARELGMLISEVSPAAVQESLRIIWESLDLPVSMAYLRAFEQLIRYREHPDAREGLAAFLQKRPPRWSTD
jgi:enoyl-CoA hydratase/carnithine racemase